MPRRAWARPRSRAPTAWSRRARLTSSSSTPSWARRSAVGGDARAVLAELAGVSAGAGHRHPVHDEPAADAARAAVEVDDVVDAARGAVEVLGDGAEARVVADDGRKARSRLRRGRGSGASIQSQVGRVADESVGGAHESGHGEPDRDDARVGQGPGAPRFDALGDDRGGLFGRQQMVDVDALAQRRCCGRGRPRRSSARRPRG